MPDPDVGRILAVTADIAILSQLNLRIRIRSTLLILSFSCCLDLDLDPLGGVFDHRYISWWHVPSDHETRVLAELKLPEDESTTYVGNWCLERLRQSVARNSGSRWWDENGEMTCCALVLVAINSGTEMTGESTAVPLKLE